MIADATIPRGVVWLVPALIAVHNAEELLTIGAAIPRVAARAPAAVQPLARSITRGDFLIALAVVTVAPAVIAAWVRRRPRSGGARFGVALVQAVMALNVASHLGAVAMLRGYGPGLATALAFNAPFSAWFFWSAWHKRWLSARALAWTVPMALLAHGPGLVGLLALSHALRGLAR